MCDACAGAATGADVGYDEQGAVGDGGDTERLRRRLRHIDDLTRQHEPLYSAKQMEERMWMRGDIVETLQDFPGDVKVPVKTPR